VADPIVAGRSPVLELALAQLICQHALESADYTERTFIAPIAAAMAIL
jgi:hypothetical protein